MKKNKKASSRTQATQQFHTAVMQFICDEVTTEFDNQLERIDNTVSR